MVTIEIAIATVVGVMRAGEVIIRRARRHIPVLLLTDSHPCKIMQDRQMRMDDLVLPEEQDAWVMRLQRLWDDKELLLRDQ